MRKLMRSVAKANMKRLGISQPCKKKTGRSFFAQFWRQYV